MENEGMELNEGMTEEQAAAGDDLSGGGQETVGETQEAQPQSQPTEEGGADASPTTIPIDRFNKEYGKRKELQEQNEQLMQERAILEQEYRKMRLQQMYQQPQQQQQTPMTQQQQDMYANLPHALRAAMEQNPEVRTWLEGMNNLAQDQVKPIKRELEEIKQQYQSEQQRRQVEESQRYYYENMGLARDNVVREMELDNHHMKDQIMLAAQNEMMNLVNSNDWHQLPEQVKWYQYQQALKNAVKKSMAPFENYTKAVIDDYKQKMSGVKNASPASASLPGSAVPPEHEEIMERVSRGEIGVEDALVDITNSIFDRYEREGGQ